MSGLQQAWLGCPGDARAQPIACVSGIARRHVARRTLDVGLTGDVPEERPRAISDQGAAVGETVRVHRHDDIATGEEAVRQGEIDVLLVDARQVAAP